MSIFWKDCPHCGIRQPAAALHCGCGYCFEPEQLEGTIEALDIKAYEEQLYYEYLSARLGQVQAANRGAADRLAGNPTERYFEALSTEAAEVLRAAEVELARQSQRVTEARERAEQARASAPCGVRAGRSSPPATELTDAAASGAGFRALQARKAALAVGNRQAVASSKCPHCTAARPPGRDRCPLCGSLLSAAVPVPSGMPVSARASRRPAR